MGGQKPWSDHPEKQEPPIFNLPPPFPLQFWNFKHLQDKGKDCLKDGWKGFLV